MREQVSEPSLKDFFLYLASVAKLYPGGIPLNCIEDAMADLEGEACEYYGPVVYWGNRLAAAVFLMTSETFSPEAARPGLFGPAGRLLRAAVEKGLRMSTSDFGFIRCYLDGMKAEDCEEKWRAGLKQVLHGSGVKIVVALGDCSWRLLEKPSDSGIRRGEWFKFHTASIMPTHSLEYVNSSPDGKREFWSDLRQLLEKLR